VTKTFCDICLNKVGFDDLNGLFVGEKKTKASPLIDDEFCPACLARVKRFLSICKIGRPEIVNAMLRKTKREIHRRKT